MVESRIREKRWVTKEVLEENIVALQSLLKVHPVICRLLALRAITNYDEAYLFFRPQLSQLHDPFGMKDMNKAVKRIEQAIAKQEKILIYGDYDVDGTTSVALVYSFLRDFYPNIGYYIPDRFVEGYGVSTLGVDHAYENGYQLMIALDCGIRSVDKVKYAKEKGIDFIICDHHLPGEELPPAVAILDPKQPDCNYPYKELSGCGIGYKLVQAFASHNGVPNEVVESFLDLVAISIASDIVPVTGENRILVYYGLKQLNITPRKGLASLIELSGVKNRKLTITDIVFYLGPRINAAGRMDHGKHAVNLLLADNDGLAMDGAIALHDNNATRKQLDKDITGEALGMIENNPQMQGRKTTVLYQPHWNKGVIGIVASRLIETWYRPTIVLTESHGMVAGSARSVTGFDIHEAIKNCGDLLEQFGGHKYAAGLTLKKENLDQFILRFEEIVAASISAEQLLPEIAVDAELDIKEVTWPFYNLLKQFAPFGPGNMRPVFLARNCFDKGYSKIVGENHLKLNITQDGIHIVPAMAFGMGHLATDILKINGRTPKFDILYCIEENEWQGETTLRLAIRDVKVNC